MPSRRRKRYVPPPDNGLVFTGRGFVTPEYWSALAERDIEDSGKPNWRDDPTYDLRRKKNEQRTKS